MPFSVFFDSQDDDDDDERIDGVAWDQRAGRSARDVAHASSENRCRGTRHPAQGWSRYRLQHRRRNAFGLAADFA